MTDHSKRQIGIWLFIGVLMFVVQIILGGGTRLTGSGLSITEWKLIHGVIPPLNEKEWQEEFDAYKQFDQYKLLNHDMTLQGFKHIFWWEFTHRLWGRLIAVAFLVPFVYFLWKRRIDFSLGKKLVLLFLMGAMQGAIGWIMVQSGLFPDKVFVNPVKLSIHLGMAAILVGYLLWVALECLQPERESNLSSSFRQFTVALLIIISVQVFYGGLMAGHHAALYYNTWPKIGDQWVPGQLFSLSPFFKNFFYSIPLIQLIHRGIAYIVCLLVSIYWLQYRKEKKTVFLRSLFNLLPVMVLLQVVLGIMTLLYAQERIPLIFAELHQMTGLSLLFMMVAILFQSRNPKRSAL